MGKTVKDREEARMGEDGGAPPQQTTDSQSGRLLRGRAGREGEALWRWRRLVPGGTGEGAARGVGDGGNRPRGHGGLPSTALFGWKNRRRGGWAGRGLARGELFVLFVCGCPGGHYIAPAGAM
jgi:hypothetical protein